MTSSPRYVRWISLAVLTALLAPSAAWGASRYVRAARKPASHPDGQVPGMTRTHEKFHDGTYIVFEGLRIGARSGKARSVRAWVGPTMSSRLTVGSKVTEPDGSSITTLASGQLHAVNHGSGRWSWTFHPRMKDGTLGAPIAVDRDTADAIRAGKGVTIVGERGVKTGKKAESY